MPPAAPLSALEGLGIFSSLSAEARTGLAARVATVALRRGDVLVAEGDPADALFVVVSGRFAVLKRGRRTAVAEIGPGQPIGEIGFLRGGARTATVTALRDSLVLKLARADFDELMDAHPGIWRTLTATLAGRLAETTAAAAPPPDPKPRTIAIIRAGQEPLSRAFVSALGTVFAKHAHATVIGRERAARLVGADTPLEAPEATQRLNEIESHYDFVLFAGDDEPSAWTEKIIRQADLVLAVGLHASDPTPNALERMMEGLVEPDAVRLVLVHEHRSRVRGTWRWLEGRHAAMHHHVALDSTADLERLYRFINGSAKGLVACGGGALCTAHIGLYKALTEEGFAFDIMGGTSAGSAMTAAFVMGSAPEEIDAAIHDMFVDHKAMRRYTVPRYSLLDHANFDEQLKRHYGGIDIEDLWLPYFAVSTNLSSYKLHVHRTGPVWEAIRASASIPVLLPPVYTPQGEMLADGCLLDNVPIRVMRELKSGPNAVVNFQLSELDRFEVDYAHLPTRAEIVRRALNPLGRHGLPDAPGMITVLMRSLMANRDNFKRHLSGEDLMLLPPIPDDMGFLDWHRHREMMDMAYAWTRAEIGRRGGEAAAGALLASG